MNPEQFLNSIYLGDRACKAILIDSWSKKISVRANVISRLRPGSATWDFYSEGDIIDGCLAFSGVRRVTFEPPGPVPNDLINDISVKTQLEIGGEEIYLFELSISSVDDSGDSTEVLVRIWACGIHLEDPAQPGVEIKS